MRLELAEYNKIQETKNQCDENYKIFIIYNYINDFQRSKGKNHTVESRG